MNAQGKSDGIQWDGLDTYLNADVVVCGGGSAGVFAAVAAAREGADVLLVESQGGLGGSAVGGLVMPYMTVRIPGEPRCSYLHKELDRRVEEYHKEKYVKNSCDPIVFGIIQEQMCAESKVKMLFHATVCGAKVENRQIRAIAVACKDGIRKIEGKRFIDCTGDASLAVLAGAGYEQGHPKTGVNQPMSLRYMVDGVDMEAFKDFLDTYDDPASAYSGRKGGGLYAAVWNKTEGALKPLFREAIANGDLTEQDMAYWQMFKIPGRENGLALNNPEFFDLTDATDPLQLTEVQLRGKAFILRQLMFYKKYFKGFDDAYISNIAPMVGIRESRRIHAKYELKGIDLLGQKKFAGCISQCNYPVDVHGGADLFQDDLPEGDPEKPWYEIPYDCLVSADVDNLLAAGRCAGADFVAQSGIRIQICCHSMGEAAGIAAAMSLDREVLPGRLAGEEVRGRMVEHGAEFIPVSNEGNDHVYMNN